MTDAVIFDNVDIVFGDNPQRALDMVDQGKTRDEIGAETGLVLGVAKASLAVKEGEILVLMGLSGSGKSTLLRAVNALAPVVRGNVSVRTESGYVDPYKASAQVLRDLRMHTVSMVFQQFGLLPWRTVADNVGFGLELPNGVVKLIAMGFMLAVMAVSRRRTDSESFFTVPLKMSVVLTRLPP